MAKTVLQETVVQKLQRKHMALESLCKSLELKIETTNRHCGSLRDDIVAIREEDKSLIKDILVKINKYMLDLTSKIDSISDRVNKHSGKISELEGKVNLQITTVASQLAHSQLDLKNDTQVRLNDFKSNLGTIERNLEASLNALLESNRIFCLTTENKIENIRDESRDSYNGHIVKVRTEISSINKNNASTISSINNTIKNIESCMNRIKKETSDINILARTSTFDILNTRLNNFREDMVEMFHVKRVANSDPDTLKRLARLEGIKEVIDHRVSAKEVLKKLEETETQLLEHERAGKSTVELRTKVEALKWVIGEKNG